MPLKRNFQLFQGDKKTPRGGIANNTDALSIVKAAAWAWYQHGSGSGRKPDQGEFVITRTTDQRVANYKPSRYKLQAMKIIEEEDTILETSSSSGPIQLITIPFLTTTRLILFPTN
ncbi:hypothetical protein Dsin_021820 [Dipteronia sinensis]|uniref:Uncharacterized protein n=1 Tax=Dipteronia sinensis TaxID=43782 RepID=A0AAE0A0D3_9ROSI|nr:hypothetical protein Dsin_021820 [Dipteronia sinensis]